MKIILLILSVFAALPAAPTGAAEALPPCPEKPNCVSSQATDGHFIKPFRVKGEAGPFFGILLKLLTERADVQLISSNASTIRVEFATCLGFVDDAIFLLDSGKGVIHIRSAARSGYWDLGKNRRRLEEIRRILEETGR